MECEGCGEEITHNNPDVLWCETCFNACNYCGLQSPKHAEYCIYKDIDKDDWTPYL